MNKPNLFIVGLPKAGTTALHNFLAQHPDIYMSEVKEPFYFCQDFHQESDQYYGHQKFYPIRTQSAYLKLFSSAKCEKILGESSAEYLYSKVAAHNIYQFNPNSRIIIVLRNPVDWIHSLHSHYVKLTIETEEDFAKALENEKYRKQGQRLTRRELYPSSLYYLDRVHYSQQIKRFFDIFPHSKIMIIIFEKYKQDNLNQYQAILDFLEVDKDFIPEFKEINNRAKPRFKFLNSWLYNPKIKSLSQKILPPKSYEFLSKNFVEKYLWKPDSGTKIPEPLRFKLMQEFKQEILKLSDMLEMDLDKQWGYDKIST